MAQCDVLLQLMLIRTAESIPATAASAAVTVAVLAQAAKATTASACWHHSATVGAVFSPVWA